MRYILIISILFSSCISLVRDNVSGNYLLRSDRFEGDFLFDEDGNFTYSISNGMYYKNSNGKYIIEKRKLLLYSKQKFDSTIINKNKLDTIGFIIETQDLNGCPYSSKIIIDNHKTYLAENGNLYLDSIYGGKIKIYFFDWVNYIEKQPIVIKNELNSNHIIVMHHNTINYPNYRYFNGEKIKVRKNNKLIFKSENPKKMIFTKRLH